MTFVLKLEGALSIEIIWVKSLTSHNLTTIQDLGGRRRRGDCPLLLHRAGGDVAGRPRPRQDLRGAAARVGLLEDGARAQVHGLHALQPQAGTNMATSHDVGTDMYYPTFKLIRANLGTVICRNLMDKKNLLLQPCTSEQVLPRVPTTYDYRSMNMVLYQEENWSEVDTKGSSILEVLLPQDTIVIKRPVSGEGGGKNSPPIGYQVTDYILFEAVIDCLRLYLCIQSLLHPSQAIVLDPNPKSVCQLLALAVEHIDTLLEDW